LSIYSTGVMFGTALAFLIGGPLGQMPDDQVVAALGFFGLGGMPQALDWNPGYGWRFAFLALGVPGVLFALVVLLTVREPPRGWSDPPGLAKTARSGIGFTFRLLLGKPSFWYMTVAASLVAMVGYGYAAFQAPMMQRLHGMPPGEFAVRFGVPLSAAGAIGTIAAGYLTAVLIRRSIRWVALLPALLLVGATLLYLLAFGVVADDLQLAFWSWVAAMLLHYGYLGAQYTIGQGVVPQSSRASAIAILLFIIALVGNGVGPQLIGFLSDTFIAIGLESRGFGGVLGASDCNPKVAGVLPAVQQTACGAAYAEGLRNSMRVTALFLPVAAACFWMSSRHLDRDLIAR
jgi:hypothetical protein